MTCSVSERGPVAIQRLAQVGQAAAHAVSLAGSLRLTFTS